MSLDISVVIPTYNRAALVCEAFHSVLAQTHPPVEILVVDDGSTDDTRSMLEAFGSQLRMLRQEHRGVAAARNLGIAAARSGWIAFLDSDDLWAPDHLDRLAAILDADSSLSWCCSNAYFQREPSGALYPATPSQSLHRAGYKDNHFDCFYSASAAGVTFHTPGFVLSASLIQNVGGFDETLVHGEDLDLWWRIARSEPAVGFDPHPTVTVRATSDALTTRFEDAGLDICDLLDRHAAALRGTRFCDKFNPLAARMIGTFAARALNRGDTKALIELHKRGASFLSYQYKMAALVARISPRTLKALMRVFRYLRRCLAATGDSS